MDPDVGQAPSRELRQLPTSPDPRDGHIALPIQINNFLRTPASPHVPVRCSAAESRRPSKKPLRYSPRTSPHPRRCSGPDARCRCSPRTRRRRPRWPPATCSCPPRS
jgi:hypothetical protein